MIRIIKSHRRTKTPWLVVEGHYFSGPKRKVALHWVNDRLLSEHDSLSNARNAAARASLDTMAKQPLLRKEVS